MPDSDAVDVAGTTYKRRKLTQHQHQMEGEFQVHEEALIPGLPDHIAQICLSSVHPSVLYSVSRSWRRLIASPSFPPYLSLYALLSPAESNNKVTSLRKEEEEEKSEKKSVEFYSFDPIASEWTQLPPRPPSIRFTVQHKSFLSLNLPIQSVSVCGKLVVVAATDPLMRPALECPLIFDPAHRSWTYGPEMAHPRRWCAAGSVDKSVYVASGVGSQFKTSVAVSVERWRFGDESERRRKKRRWEKMREMKDVKLSREAVEAVGCRGKLYMVNVKGNAAKEGFVYDTVKDEWEEMKEGMVGGWRGPAAAMDEEEMFMVDERRGVLMRYEWEKDMWCEVVESESLKGAEQMAAGGGRVCVVVGGGILVVDVACGMPRVWVVETPCGLRANSVHVLPRML